MQHFLYPWSELNIALKVTILDQYAYFFTCADVEWLNAHTREKITS